MCSITVLFRTVTIPTIYKKYEEGGRGVMDQPTQQHFTVTGKVWRVVRDNKLIFLQQLLFLEICKRGLSGIGSLTLSKHVYHFGPRIGFPYYNLIVPLHHSKAPTLIRHRGRTNQLCWFEPCKSSPVHTGKI